MDEKVAAWRSLRLHRKCKFCKYLQYIVAPSGVSYFECVGKDKIINSGWPDCAEIPRPFCKLFELKI